MYKTKSVMLHERQIEQIREMVEYSKDIMLFHSFSAVMRIVLERGLNGAKQYFHELGKNRPPFVEIVREKQKDREKNKNEM